tara:strand:+ start:561 stop:770 length:210 start_codon:yes stop_codon:yes gene_type:complete
MGHEPISNEIFEHYRILERVKEQKKAIKILIAQGYTILDLEGNILNKHTTKIDSDGNRLMLELDKQEKK